jgi:ribosomal protein S12 methylthiotransferase
MAERFAIISLGCAKNLVDSETMVNEMLAAGYKATGDVRTADVVIVNTCSFIAPAREEAHGVFAEVQRKAAPGVTVIVTGCYSQMAGERIKRLLPRVGAVLGTAYYGRITDAIKAVRAGERPVWVNEAGPDINVRRGPVRLTAPHLAYLKIADGCSHKCTFCVIPQLRGPYRSRPPTDIIAEAEDLKNTGARELVLLAQDTSAYGTDSASGSLAELIGELDNVDVPWVRVMYLHPARVDERLLDAFAAAKSVLPYFDIPLQHASPKTLKSMGRPAWKPEATLDRLAAIREKVPGAAVRTAFLVGFPGESWADFEALANFVADARFEHMGAFEYSPEEGTPAVRLPDRVPADVTAERYHKLMTLQQGIVEDRARRLVGSSVDVIIDKIPPSGPAIARARFQAPETDGVTYMTGLPENVKPGDIIKVKIIGHDVYDLVAEPAGGPDA